MRDKTTVISESLRDITIPSFFFFKESEKSRSNNDLSNKILLVLLGIFIGIVMSATGYVLKGVFNRFQCFC